MRDASYDFLRRLLSTPGPSGYEEAAAKVAHLAASPVYISARAGEGGKLFGSVTNSDVARAILDQVTPA